jgi:hypothetical protein
MPTRETLLSWSKKQLQELARKRGIAGYSRMTKQELVSALTKEVRRRSSRTNGTVTSHETPSGPRKKAKGAHDRTAPSEARGKGRSRTKAAAGRAAETRTVSEISPIVVHDLAASSVGPGEGSEEITVSLVDPYWLEVRWLVSRQSIERAKATLAFEWYQAQPVLRLVELIDEEAAYSREVIEAEQPILTPTNRWFFHVPKRDRLYRVELGYRTQEGRFVLLVRSQPFRTPSANVGLLLETGGPETGDREAVTASSTRGHRGLRGEASFLMSEFDLVPEAVALPPELRQGRTWPLWLRVEAELWVRGATTPGARINVSGEPIQTDSNGTFLLRLLLPDGRQIIPISATSADGQDERTVVLAIERNTKELEPLPFEDRSV